MRDSTLAQLSPDKDSIDQLRRYLSGVPTYRQRKHGVDSAVGVTQLGRYFQTPGRPHVGIGEGVAFAVIGRTVADRSDQNARWAIQNGLASDDEMANAQPTG